MNPTNHGYFRSPTVYQDQVVFICEDDLWQVSLSGGRATRLTNSRSNVKTPHYSPDGQRIACCAQEEGLDDVYVFSGNGGPLKRLTYLNTFMRIIGWELSGKEIIFWSQHQCIHGRSDGELYSIPVEGGAVKKLPYGPALAYGTDGKGVVIGRNAYENFGWKRYRGGMVGEVWVKPTSKKRFTNILNKLNGNPINPFWINDRIYFVSDHKGIANIFSCLPNGKDIRQETFQETFYVRQPTTDGLTIVYYAGGDLFSLNLANKEEQLIDIKWHGPRDQLQRKFFYGDDYLEDIDIHPDGHSVAITARGSLFSMPLWERAVSYHGSGSEVRSRLGSWLADGRLVAILDQEKDQEQLAVYPKDSQQEPELLLNLPSGRVQNLICAPEKKQIAISTNRMNLYLMEIDGIKTTKLDESSIREIQDLTFSSDGKWLAYSKALSLELTAIFLVDLETYQVHQITYPIRHDFSPSFDPEGKYLYFLSSRIYNPISDSVQIGVSFVRSVKPYLITLQKETTSPFLSQPHAPGKHEDEEKHAPGKHEDEEKHAESKEEQENPDDKNKKEKEKEALKKIQIDWEGIEHRILEFPVDEGLYHQIIGLPHKVIFTEFFLKGSLDDKDAEDDQGYLWCYDFEKQEVEEMAKDVSWIQVNTSAQTLLYYSNENVRVVEAGVPVPEDHSDGLDTNRKTGWLDLGRVRISVDYVKEWRQMYREAWRLQKEFFWRKDLSGVDWEKVYEQYSPLLERIGSRTELSDLIWETQGELGTSHTYEYGGDYPSTPVYKMGRLGVDLEYDQNLKCYVFEKIYRGDVWKANEHSPLCEPGINIEEGDCLVAIGGTPINLQTAPGELLSHQGEQEVTLSVQSAQNNSEIRHITIKTLHSDQRTRYREWVNTNAQIVSDKSENQIGYIHIPDMSSWGISEFHRGFLAQTDKKGLIIDVRYNAGGMVSPLILEKLSHQHLGYDVPRWGASETYPYHTMRGHLIVLANEFTGSDGDMFCQSFRTLKLGKIIGKRTWGGVIGIDSRYRLVDRTVTTQPQYSAWFEKGEWSVENYGVEPDIKVEFSPEAYAKKQDPQLERGIKEMLKLLNEHPVSTVEYDPINRQSIS